MILRQFAGKGGFKAIWLSAALVQFPWGAALADDWPQWRGPDRNDVSKETGLLQEWPEKGPKLLWASTNLGAGYCTVAIEGGRIFTVGDRPDANFVFALNEKDGKQVWAAKLGKGGHRGGAILRGRARPQP